MPAYDGSLEDVIRPFIDAMRYKLAANKHAGTRHWRDTPLADLLAWLRNEVDELEEAIRRGNTIEMLLESADVSNLAMFVANVAIEHARNGHGSHFGAPEIVQNPVNVAWAPPAQVVRIQDGPK